MATALTLYKDLDGTSMVIGHVIRCPASGTFWFNPRVQRRMPSRKQWPTAESAIPGWANKMADRIEKKEISA